ncbi:MAG: hypothetical protein M2R45_01310 [Verrucomicrobia subdivision 3 bacterium]|nr:hypothetical protein [Limisphaerales bacterium]MCS1415176.1 hypothetical protein [Limisphaerales bacterium]
MHSATAFGNHLALAKDQRFVQSNLGIAMTKTGWSHPEISTKKGDEDLYIVNGHLTSASVRDYKSHFWRYDIYLGNSDEVPISMRFSNPNKTQSRKAMLSSAGTIRIVFFWIGMNKDSWKSATSWSSRWRSTATILSIRISTAMTSWSG